MVVVSAAIGLGNAQKKSAAADYGDALNSASALMLLGAQDAERCGNLIKQVWANAIYEERDDATDPTPGQRLFCGRLQRRAGQPLL